MVLEAHIKDRYQTSLRMKGNNRIVGQFGKKEKFRVNKET